MLWPEMHPGLAGHAGHGSVDDYICGLNPCGSFFLLVFLDDKTFFLFFPKQFPTATSTATATLLAFATAAGTIITTMTSTSGWLCVM